MIKIRFIYLLKQNMYRMMIKKWYGWRICVENHIEYTTYFEHEDPQRLLENVMWVKYNTSINFTEVMEYPVLTIYGGKK